MQQDERGIGPLIGSIVVIALIVLGGFYFWKESQTATPPSQATNDEMGAIESDLEAGTNFSFDAEMQDLDSAQ